MAATASFTSTDKWPDQARQVFDNHRMEFSATTGVNSKKLERCDQSMDSGNPPTSGQRLE